MIRTINHNTRQSVSPPTFIAQIGGQIAALRPTFCIGVAFPNGINRATIECDRGNSGLLIYNNYMQWYEADVRSVEKEIASRALSSPVVFYGSSSIRLWSTLPEDVGSEYVLNLGFGGSTLEACVYFFERILLAAKPCSLVLYAGDNDLGDGKSSTDVVGYYRKFASKMESALPDVCYGFISIKPSPARVSIIDRISKANADIGQEILKNSKAYYIDVFTSMLDAGGKPRRELYQPDGLHLNSEGYKLWTELILRHRNQIFNQDFNRAHEA